MIVARRLRGSGGNAAHIACLLVAEGRLVAIIPAAARSLVLGTAAMLWVRALVLSQTYCAGRAGAAWIGLVDCTLLGIVRPTNTLAVWLAGKHELSVSLV